MEVILNITNNTVNYNRFFSGKYNEKSKMQNKNSTIGELTDKLCEILHERAELEVPRNGKVSQISVSYTIPDTQNKAKVAISSDPINPSNLRRVSVSSYRIGSDRMVSTYIFKGTKQEVLNYILTPQCQSQIVEIASKLSDSVDKYYLENY